MKKEYIAIYRKMNVGHKVRRGDEEWQVVVEYRRRSTIQRIGTNTILWWHCIVRRKTWLFHDIQPADLRRNDFFCLNLLLCVSFFFLMWVDLTFKETGRTALQFSQFSWMSNQVNNFPSNLCVLFGAFDIAVYWSSTRMVELKCSSPSFLECRINKSTTFQVICLFYLVIFERHRCFYYWSSTRFRSLADVFLKKDKEYLEEVKKQQKANQGWFGGIWKSKSAQPGSSLPDLSTVSEDEWKKVYDEVGFHENEKPEDNTKYPKEVREEKEGRNNWKTRQLSCLSVVSSFFLRTYFFLLISYYIEFFIVWEDTVFVRIGQRIDRIDRLRQTYCTCFHHQLWNQSYASSR